MAIKGLEKRRVTRDCRLIGGDRNWGFCNKGGGTQLSWPGNEAILFMSIDFVDALCMLCLITAVRFEFLFV